MRITKQEYHSIILRVTEGSHAVPTHGGWQYGTSLWERGGDVGEGSSYCCLFFSLPPRLLEDQGAMSNAEWFPEEFQGICEPLHSSNVVEHLMQVAWTKHCWFLSPLWSPGAWRGVPRLLGTSFCLWRCESGWMDGANNPLSQTPAACAMGQLACVGWSSQAKASQPKNNTHLRVYTHPCTHPKPTFALMQERQI